MSQVAFGTLATMSSNACCHRSYLDAWQSYLPNHTLHYTTFDTFTYAKKRWKPSLRKFYFTMPEIVYHLSLVVQTFIYKIVKNQVAFGGAQLEHHQPHESLKCYHLVMPHFVRENLKMFRDWDQASYPNSKSSRKKYPASGYLVKLNGSYTIHHIIWNAIETPWNAWTNSETKRWPTGTNNFTPETSESFQFRVPQNEVPLKITRFLKRA